MKCYAQLERETVPARALKIFTLAVALGWAIACVSAVFQVEDTAEWDGLFQTQYIGDDHVDMHANMLSKEHFDRVEDAGWVGIFFGVKNFRERHYDYWWQDELGSIRLDNDFNMSKPASQAFMLELCQEIREDKSLLRVSVSLEESFWCWILKFEEYVREVRKLDFPIESDQEFYDSLYFWINSTQSGADYRNEQAFFVRDDTIILS